MNKKLENRIARAYKFAAAPGAPYNDEQAQEIVGPEFQKIRDSGRPLTPETIIERAQNSQSKLKQFFDWDDEVAGPKWRQHQARTIANHLVVIIHTEDGVVEKKAEYSFVTRQTPDSPAERQYFNFQQVQDDPILRARLFESAMRELRTFVKKYRTGQIPQLEPVFSLVDEMTK